MAGWDHRLYGMSLSKLWEFVVDREAWHAVIHGVEKSQTRLNDWTELNDNPVCKATKETQVYRTVLWTLWERARVGLFGEWHWNMYIIISETNHQSRFNAWDRMLGAGALGWPRGMGWGGRWEGVQDGEHIYTRGRFLLICGKTNIIMYSNYSPIKINKVILKKKKNTGVGWHSYSRRYSQPQNWTHILAGRFFTTVPPEKPSLLDTIKLISVILKGPPMENSPGVQ